MRLNTYNARDLNMYLSETYSLYKGTPTRINGVEYMFEGDLVDNFQDTNHIDTVRFHCVHKTESSFESSSMDLPYTGDFPLVPIVLGYRTVGDYVVFIMRKQRNSYKKLPSKSTVSTFVPQQAEFDYIGKSTNFSMDDILLAVPVYTPIEEAYKEVVDKTNYSVVLHANYALVKKGRFKNPVIYYRTDPVIEFDGTNFTPLIDECHVTKFKLEVGLL